MNVCGRLMWVAVCMILFSVSEGTLSQGPIAINAVFSRILSSESHFAPRQAQREPRINNKWFPGLLGEKKQGISSTSRLQSLSRVK